MEFSVNLNTEHTSKPIYWTCEDCGCEAAFSGSGKMRCPSCGAWMSDAQYEKVKAALRSMSSSGDIYEDALNGIDQEPITLRPEPDLLIRNGNLVRYNGKKRLVVIPAKVSSISPRAFSGCDTVREVVIPNDVKVIPYAAFENCSNLEKVTLSRNLDTIGPDAFKGCGRLKDVSLTPSVSRIERNAFAGVQSLDYETMFSDTAALNKHIQIEDSWLSDKYSEVLKKQAKPKRKIPVFVYAAAALVLLLGIGYFVKTRIDFSNQIKIAQSYAASRQYEKALDAYMAAGRISPRSDKVKNGMMSVYIDWGNELMYAGDYEEALKKYSMAPDSAAHANDVYTQWGNSLLEEGKYEEAIDAFTHLEEPASHIAEAYMKWSDHLASEGDYEAAQNVLNEGIEKYGLSEELSGHTENIESQKYINGVKASMAEIAKDIDAGNYEEALRKLDNLESSRKDINYHLANDYPLLADLSGTQYSRIGLYTSSGGHFTIYYGGYEENQRKGTGTYLYRYSGDPENDKYNYAIGKWNNDAPNGTQSIYSRGYEGSTCIRDSITTVNVVDGVYDGQAQVEDRLTNVKYSGEYDNGTIVVQGTETQNGKTFKVVFYSEDKRNWRYYEDESMYSDRFAMFGY